MNIRSLESYVNTIHEHSEEYSGEYIFKLIFNLTFLYLLLNFCFYIKRTLFPDSKKNNAVVECLKAINESHNLVKHTSKTTSVTTGEKAAHLHIFDNAITVDPDYGPHSERQLTSTENEKEKKRIPARNITRFSKSTEQELTSSAHIILATATTPKVDDQNVYELRRSKKSTFTFKIDPSILSKLSEEEEKILRDLLVRGKFIPGDTKGQNGIIQLISGRKQKNKSLFGYTYKFKDCSENVRFYARPKKGVSDVFIIDYKNYHKKNKKF